MPKHRKTENKGLPSRWIIQHGAFYYCVPKGLESRWDGKKLFRLGKTAPEAYKTWSDRIGAIDNMHTVGQLLDRYALEIVPTKAIATQRLNAGYIRKLRSSFGHMAPDEIEPQHIYQYVEARRKKYVDDDGKAHGGLSAAKREVAMFSDVFTKAIMWGVMKSHPFKGVIRLEGERPRKRYVTDDELAALLTMESTHSHERIDAIKAYIKIKLLTGMRQQDLLRLKLSDLKDDGIHVTPKKTINTTGASLIIEWSEELRGAVEEAKAARKVHISPWLFCTRRGESFYNEEQDTASGWKSIWKRFIARAVKGGILKERFTEHDLRAKCASDTESLEHARQLLAHADSRITNKVYRRKAEKVKPLR